MDSGAARAACPARAVGLLSARSERLGLDFKGLGWRQRAAQREAGCSAELRGGSGGRAAYLLTYYLLLALLSLQFRWLFEVVQRPAEREFVPRARGGASPLQQRCWKRPSASSSP